MAGRAPQRMRPRDESAHGVVRDAYDKGYLDSGQPYVIPGFTSHEAANQGRLSVNRGLRHLGFAPRAWVTDQYGEQCWSRSKAKGCAGNPNSPHTVKFELSSAESARQHVLDTTGGDPAKLKWNPYRRAESPLIDDYGAPI